MIGVITVVINLEQKSVKTWMVVLKIAVNIKIIFPK